MPALFLLPNSSYYSQKYAGIIYATLVASGGQSLLIFRRATWWFKELKAFVASTRRTASVSLESKAVLTACTAASIPAICPPHIWRQPEASCMSGFASGNTALAIIRRAVSRCLLVERLGSCLGR